MNNEEKMKGHRHTLAMMLAATPRYDGDDPRALHYAQNREALEAALTALSPISAGKDVRAIIANLESLEAAFRSEAEKDRADGYEAAAATRERRADELRDAIAALSGPVSAEGQIERLRGQIGEVLAMDLDVDADDARTHRAVEKIVALASPIAQNGDVREALSDAISFIQHISQVTGYPSDECATEEFAGKLARYQKAASRIEPARQPEGES